MTLREKFSHNKFIIFLYRLPLRVILPFIRLIPLQNKIVFSNFFGRGLGDDPKYILQQLIKDGVDAKFVWLLNNMNDNVPLGILKVKYGSYKAQFHYATAKVWIDNIKNNPKPKKRKGQFYIQTWHGSFSNKMVEKDVEKYLDPEYIKASKQDSKKIDLMYSNNDFRINQFKKIFWYKGSVIKCGLPKLSILFNDSSELKKKIAKIADFPATKKIILYAPTFRTNNNIQPYLWDYQHIISVANEKFEDDFIMLFRLHPNVASQLDISTNFENIINVSNYPDMDELVAISDVMISDFSGVPYEFALTGRPVFLFAQDYNEYLKKERNLYFTLKELPFSLSKDEFELCNNIKNFNADAYQEKIRVFYSKIGLKDDGNGAVFISNLVKKLL